MILHIRILKEASKDLFNKTISKKLPIRLGISLWKMLSKAMHVIERLNPKPGGGDIDERQNHIIPDFFVEKVDGELVISLKRLQIAGTTDQP